MKVLNSACQQLNEQGVKAFDDEVHMLARIRHPHICLFMGACMTPPSRAIVTELVSMYVCVGMYMCMCVGAAYIFHSSLHQNFFFLTLPRTHTSATGAKRFPVGLPPGQFGRVPYVYEGLLPCC